MLDLLFANLRSFYIFYDKTFAIRLLLVQRRPCTSDLWNLHRHQSFTFSNYVSTSSKFFQLCFHKDPQFGFEDAEPVLARLRALQRWVITSNCLPSTSSGIFNKSQNSEENYSCKRIKCSQRKDQSNLKTSPNQQILPLALLLLFNFSQNIPNLTLLPATMLAALDAKKTGLLGEV